MQSLQIYENCSQQKPLWRAKSTKIVRKCNPESNIKTNLKQSAKVMQKNEVLLLPNKAYRLKMSHTLTFAASAKNNATWPQNGPWNDPDFFKITAGGFSKAMQRMCIKINTHTMRENAISGRNYPQELPKRDCQLTFWNFCWYLLPRWHQDAQQYKKEMFVHWSAGPPLGGATWLRRSALSPESSVSALSPKLRLWPWSSG